MKTVPEMFECCGKMIQLQRRVYKGAISMHGGKYEFQECNNMIPCTGIATLNYKTRNMHIKYKYQLKST
jgi:hypothetical protein